MTPMAKDADWAETISHIDDLEQEMQFPRYTCEVNDVKYVATTSYRTITSLVLMPRMALPQYLIS